MEKKILIYGMGTTGKAVKKFCENNKIKYFTFDAVSYTHLTLPTNREV